MDTMQFLRQERWFLAAIFFISLALRLILFFGFLRHDEHYLLDFDSDQYRLIAKAVVDGKGFVASDDKPTAYRLPGYPLYLAACYKHAEDNDIFAMLLQIFLACFIPLLMFLCALAIFPKQIVVARIAAGAAALHPGLMLYAGILSTETLFFLFFLMFLIVFFSVFGDARYRPILRYNTPLFLSVLLSKMYRRTWGVTQDERSACQPELVSGSIKEEGQYLSLKPLFFSGLLLGIASLIRAVGPYVLILVLFFITLHFWNKKKRAIIAGICFVGGWLLPVSVWLVRNCMIFGACFLHTLPGLHFLQYSATYVVMDKQKSDYFQARNHLFALWHDKVACQEKFLGRQLNEYEYYKEAEKLAVATLRCNPKLAVKHACIQMIRTCGTLYSTLFLYVKPGTVYGDDASLWFKIKLYLCPILHKPFLIAFVYEELFYSLWLLLGVLIGIFLMFVRRAKRTILLMLLVFSGALIAMTLAYGCARLRMPADIFFIILASYGWGRVCTRAKRPV